MARETDPHTPREHERELRDALLLLNEYPQAMSRGLTVLAFLVEMAERGHAQNCSCHSEFGPSVSISSGKAPHPEQTYCMNCPPKEIHSHPYRDPRCSTSERKEGE